MTDAIHITAPLRRWTSGGASWFLLTITGAPADALAGHALMRRLEDGRARGFGSVRVTAQIGGTRWDTSAFPQADGGWVMPVKAEVRRAEGLDEDATLELTLELR